MITIKKTRFEQVKLIELEAFEDHRGEYVETYNNKIYQDAGIDVHFVQDDYSISTRHVLRGIHGDETTWKLISCPYGKLYFIVVDCNPQSHSFGQWESFILSEYNHRQVLVPPFFGNGHLVLSDRAIFSYKQSTYYDPASQFSYRWNEKRFNIWWPISNPVLSRRDQVGKYVES